MALHEKLERKRRVAADNEAVKGSFRETFAARIDQLLGSLREYEAAHAAGCAQLGDSVGSGLVASVAGLGRLTSLLQQLADADRAALAGLQDGVQTHAAHMNR